MSFSSFKVKWSISVKVAEKSVGNHHALVLGYAPKHFFTVTLIRGHPMVTIVPQSCQRLFSVAINQMLRNCKVSIMI